jgi:cytochrome c oxidase cbb3-type subunit 3
VWLFYGTILFAVGYMVNYHTSFGHGLSMEAQYQVEMKRWASIKMAAMSQFEASIPTLQPSKDPVVVENGHKLFLQLCAPCHRKDGGGLIGPNLCDEYWIHGSNFSDNVTTIWNGVPAKGMVTWKNSLKPEQVYAAASYIYTLRGTHPPNPKPPENQQQQTPAKPSEFE